MMSLQYILHIVHSKEQNSFSSISVFSGSLEIFSRLADKSYVGCSVGLSSLLRDNIYVFALG